MDPDIPPLFQEGHAPGAKILSFSISLAGGAGEVWPTTSDVVLDAIERLMVWMLANVPERVHVLNISYSLFPDPDEPTQLALDLLEREFDVLVVAAASNEGDATGQAPGFTNGLSVGNVHKWYYTTGFPAARYPHRTTSRGPLFGDGDRYYPDVCASGASVGTSRLFTTSQIVMPMLDDRHQPVPPLNSCRQAPGIHNQWYDAAGTSMASPQVAGAAALYRAERLTATALETKAAVLLATVDPLQAAQTPMALQTYIDRNATGVGYVRDDLLAIYAKRSSSPNPDNDGTSAVLTPQAPSVSIPYTGLTIGARYAVAVAWPRVFPTGEEPASVPWANLDLEVQTMGGAPALIARSDSLRNTYERLVFKAEYSSVTTQVTAVDFEGAMAVPVFVAYRKLTNITVTVNGAPSSFESRRSIPGFVTTLAQEPACSHSVPDQSVTRTLPASYRDAYGSGPFAVGSADSGDAFPSMPIGTSQQIVEFIYAASELGSGGAPFPIRGLALRSWSPFRGCNGNLTIQEVYLYRRAHTAGTTLTGLLHRTNTPRPDLDPDTVLVALNLAIPVHNPTWNARGYETWPIIIPFATEFVVDPTKALGIWIRFASGNVCPNPTNSYGIDYVDDQQPGMPLPYAMYHPSWGSAGIDGAAAVFGLLEGVTASRNVQVDLYGFPRVSADVLFQIRQATPNSFAVIGLGVANPNAPVGACRFLSSADLLITGGLATSSMGDATWSFTFPGGLLHQHIFAQALTASGLYSNGLRLTIGGIAP